MNSAAISVGDLVPHHHGMALGVGFGDDRQQLARPRLREPEGKAHDALDAGAGQDRDVGRDFERQALVDAAADAGIFAFRVFADDDPVEFLAVHVAQRAGDAGQDAGRADIGVLIERLADREPQAPQRDVVGHVRRAGGAEQDGVVFLDLVAAVLRHHDAVLLVVFGPPVEMIDLELEIAVALGQRVQHLDACGNDFGADPVARDGCYGVRLHRLVSGLRMSLVVVGDRSVAGAQFPLAPAALMTAPQRGTSAVRCALSAAGVARSAATGSVPRLANRSITLGSFSAA